jgi:hypothetical protein
MGRVPRITPEEQTRRDRIKEIRTELDALNGARPIVHVDAEGDLVCPFCGASDFQYIEDIGNSRKLDSFDAETRELRIDGFYETNGSDDGDDGRLFCNECYEEAGIPADVEIDWV